MRVKPIKEIHPINHVSDFRRSSETGIFYLPKDKVEISEEGMLLLEKQNSTPPPI